MTARPAVGYFWPRRGIAVHVALADEKPCQFLEAGIVADHHQGSDPWLDLAHDLQKPADRRFVDPRRRCASRSRRAIGCTSSQVSVRPPRRRDDDEIGQEPFPLQVVGHDEGCLLPALGEAAGRGRARRRARRPWRGGGAGDGAFSRPSRLAMKASFSNRLTSCSFFKSAPCSGGMSLRVSRSRSFSGPISSDSRSLSQSSSSEVEGFFFRPGTSRTSKKILQGLLDQPALDAGIMDLDDPRHGLSVGKLDVVEEAAAQEGVRQLLLVVGGDDDDRALVAPGSSRRSRRRGIPCGRVRAGDRSGTRYRPCRSRR